ncbi:MAG: P1 family peptidase [Candidatus Pacearchaeota archaeon]
MISIPKVSFAHYTDLQNITGTTVFVFDEPLLCVADKRGGAQTTRQVDALFPPHISLGIDALVLSGGSAFGLNSAAPVVQFLKERGVGFGIGNVRVPRVPTACIFDLLIGQPVAPSVEEIYQACLSLKREFSDEDFGCVGAGTGATCGKIFGVPNSTKAGIGFAWSSIKDEEGYEIKNFVFAVVNAFGNIVDNGKIIAGARKGGSFFDFVEFSEFHPPRYPQDYFSSTVLLVGFTEGTFGSSELAILAQAMNSALASCVKPAHTPFDGDIAFAISCATKKANIFSVFGEFYRLTRKAVIDSIFKAKSLGGIPAYSDIKI